MQFCPLLLTAMAVLLAAPATAGATTIPAASPNDLCPGLPDPCIVGRGLDYQVSGPQNTFDFGQRAVVFEQGATLQAGSGTVSLLLGSLTLDPGAALVAPAGTLNVTATGAVMILRSGSTRAKIDVNDPLAPGLVTITAGGPIVVDGYLEARGTSKEGGSGAIDILGSSLEIAGEILVSGGILSDGGTASLQSTDGAVLVSGLIDASGGFAGQISIDAVGGPLTTVQGLSYAKLDVRATGTGGDGGSVELTATGNVSLGTPILGRGEAAGTDDFGGIGGDVDIISDRSIVLGPAASIDLPGAVPEGDGGNVTLAATLDIVQSSSITAYGRASFGAGGTFEAAAQRDLTLGDIEVLCDNCVGGEIFGSAWCDLYVPSAALLDARGTNGSIQLSTGGTMIIEGRLRSTDNTLLHLTGTPPPDIAGAILIEPAATQIEDPDLTPCGGIPPAGCGNGIVEGTEECDDGNAEPCDDCSLTCLWNECGNGRIDCGEVCDDGALADECAGDCAADCMALYPVCGNGIVECDEEGDDGNHTDCDGVSSTCVLEGCGNGLLECDEECDAADDPDCNAELCRLAPVNCGNAVVDDGEECDDGNTADCDGCSHLCTGEGCGNNIVETCPAGAVLASEECDDGNGDCNDGCSPQCRFEYCGNGIVDCGEPCDEGDQNGQPGASCVALDDGEGGVTCVAGELCTTESDGPCVPCGTTTECDPLNLCGLAECIGGVCTPVLPPDCNDGNACTTDACNPASGCVNRDTCNDANACTDDVCDPATGCSHTDVVCDDDDLCTDEACDAVAGCLRVEQTGFAAVICRVTTLESLLAAATDGELHRKARKKIGAFLRRTRKKITAAQGGIDLGRSRKVTRSMRGAVKQVDRLRRYIDKQRGRRIADALAGAMLDAIGDLGVRVRSLQVALAG